MASVRGEQRTPLASPSGEAFGNRNPFSGSRLPFGGLKRGGHRQPRERYDALEFVNIKTVVVAQ